MVGSDIKERKVRLINHCVFLLYIGLVSQLVK